MHNIQEYPNKHVSYLQQILSGSRRPLGLFVGAGCPTSIRNNSQETLIPDVDGLTDDIRTKLSACEEYSQVFRTIDSHFVSDGICSPTIEDVLSHIRSLCAVVGKGRVRDLEKVDLERLDKKICDLIHRSVDKQLPRTDNPYYQVASWIDAIERERPVEVFTTNYDLLMEQALERYRVPYFDGFAGVSKPLFDPRTMEDDDLPIRWVRLWKLHGSINWYESDNREIFRGTTNESGTRRVIHPSHLKYHESRRMPYLAMIDRLRDFLKDRTSVLIICGYSFRDDHINDTLARGLMYTQTAAAFALLYGDLKQYDGAVNLATERPNLSVLSRDGAVIGGQKIDWGLKSAGAVSNESGTWVKWIPTTQDNCVAQLSLGDFNELGRFLRAMAGDFRRRGSDSDAE